MAVSTQHLSQQITDAMSSNMLYLFGDQTGDVLPTLRNLTKLSARYPSLKDFFVKSTDRLRSAVRSGVPEQRHLSFANPLDLALTIKRDELHDPALLGALLCISQIGSLIVHLELQPGALETSESQPVVLGVCTGLLAATAACCSRGVTDLLLIADHVVELAFRVGLEARRLSTYIEQSTESWAVLVSNVDTTAAVQAIEQFNAISVLEPTHKAYISAEGISSITISGPPSTLDSLFGQSAVFTHSRRVALPIYSAFHAPHLDYAPWSHLMEGLGSTMMNRPFQGLMLISPNSGQPYSGANFSEILPDVLSDIFKSPIDIKAAVDRLSQSLASQASVVCFGPSNIAKSISKALSVKGMVSSEVQNAAFHNTNEVSDPNAIAIVGMAARLPGSETLDELWQVLEDGRDLHEKIRPDRFELASHFDSSGQRKNTTLTPYGVFIDRPGFFDTRLFNMSPREAAQTDPQQRLLLLTTYEALEMAGYQPNATPSTSTLRIGSYIGQTSDDYREVNASQDIDTYFITGGIRAFGPGRLNYHFGWEGPSYSVDTACSSSAASIQLACSALIARECDMAVGGGANLLTSSDLFAGLSRGSFLSKTGGCKTFDDEADGYVRADAVGVMVLKRLADAVDDRDNILAIIKGATTNHSAEAVSITHPHAGTQERLFRAVLAKAGLEPQDIDYVELHGTGTQAGDATESRSVTNVLSPGRSSPLYIGTVKPNLGHGEAASGITSLIKATLMFKKNIIVPHVGIKGTINHRLPPLAKLNTHISFGKTPFVARPNGDGKRRILINNFDAAGGNTSMIVEEGSEPQVQGTDPRCHHVVAVSAKTPKALAENSQRLLQYITKHPETRLEDIAYTTTARRMHHELRQAHSVSSLTELSVALRTALPGTMTAKRPANQLSPVFLFTGQGSLYPGMALELFDTHSGFRGNVIEYDRICRSHGFTSFLPLIAAEENRKATPQQVQLAIVAVELAVAEMWKSLGVWPSATLGHSLGEYPALYTAGVLSLSDCLYLVGKRAEIMSSECTPGTHSMLAIKQGVFEVEALVRDRAPDCETACENSPQSTVVSGGTNQIIGLQRILNSQGIQSSTLEVQFAFHSAQMDPVLDKYEAVARRAHFRKPTIPFASTLLGEMVVEEGVINAAYLKRQTRMRVRFAQALQSLKSNRNRKDPCCWIETGPNPVCLGLVRATLGIDEVMLPSLKRGESDWKILSDSISKAYRSGLDVDWPAHHRLYRESLRLLELPNYGFDLKNHWIRYEGDWSIRKSEAATTQAAVLPSEPSFSTTTLHNVESEVHDSDGVTVTLVANASEPKLNKILRGHLVNGAGLCSSSVYADMAFTAANYLQKRMIPQRSLAMDVRDMQVHKPLIIQPDDTKQIIRVVARQRPLSDVVQIEFSSQDGETRQDHANCTVAFGDGNAWRAKWLRNAYLVKARMDHLVASSAVGHTHKILRPLVYKLFAALVDYDPKYRGMEEVYLDSDLLEATANVKFATEDSDGNFTYSPYWIDSLTHLSGFVLNGADTAPADSVYISHGWRSLKIVGELSSLQKYRSYVRMQATDTLGVLSGDVYFLHGDEVVAVCEDLKFQRIKKMVLDHIIPQTKSMVPPHKSDPVQFEGHVQAAQRQVRAGSQRTEQLAAPSRDAVDTVLKAIASEVGVERNELNDDVLFSDIGVDSLLSISIVARLGTLLAEQVPATLFSEYASVRELREYIGGMRTGDVLTPTTDDSISQSPDESESVTSASLTTPQTGTPPGGLQPVEELRKIIAQEVGLGIDEIDEATPLSDYGVDSLLSLSILATINMAGMDLPSSFLIEHPTIATIRSALEGSSTTPLDLMQEIALAAKQKTPVFRAEAVLLQVGADKQAPALFLLPDGSGSAGSYTGLPRLNAAGDVYGLNSPFLKSPESFQTPLHVVAAMYVQEIRRVQPQGPYRLGGWSIGGSYAFEAASQLARDHGEGVDKLILIDAPCPKTLPPLPLETIDVVVELGVLKGVKSERPEAWRRTKLHFEGSVNALRQYKPATIPTELGPKTVLIFWAAMGVWETVGAGQRDSWNKRHGDMGVRNAASDWIMDRREDHGAAGWETLLPGADIQVEVVAGNHFSMMQHPQQAELGHKLACVLAPR